MPVVFERGEARVGRVIKLCLLKHAQAGNLSSVGGLSSEGMEGFGASFGFYPMGQQAVQGKQPAQGLSGLSSGLPIFRVSWKHRVSISIRVSHAPPPCPLLARKCCAV